MLRAFLPFSFAPSETSANQTRVRRPMSHVSRTSCPSTAPGMTPPKALLLHPSASVSGPPRCAARQPERYEQSWEEVYPHFNTTRHHGTSLRRREGGHASNQVDAAREENLSSHGFNSTSCTELLQAPSCCLQQLHLVNLAEEAGKMDRNADITFADHVLLCLLYAIAKAEV